MRPRIFFLSFYLLSFAICGGLLYIYNNIAKIIALQLLQREQASLLFRMVHAIAAISPPHVDPTSTFYGILFSTLGLLHSMDLLNSFITQPCSDLSFSYFSSFSLFSCILGYLLFKEFILLVSVILGIYLRCAPVVPWEVCAYIVDKSLRTVFPTHLRNSFYLCFYLFYAYLLTESPKKKKKPSAYTRRKNLLKLCLQRE